MKKALKIGNFLHRFPVLFHNCEVLEEKGRKKVLAELKRKINSSTRGIGDLNTPLAIIDKINRQKINRGLEQHNKPTRYNRYMQILYQITTKYIFFSVHMGHFSIQDNVRTQIKSPTQ